MLWYTATFLDLPAGVDRCALGNATYTSAPSNGFTPRTVTSQACTRQVLLETLGDLLWIDLNGDGRQDNVGGAGGETPIAGAEVRLRLQSTSALVATTLTTAAGIYLFDRRQHGVQAGVQYVIETDPRPGPARDARRAGGRQSRQRRRERHVCGDPRRERRGGVGESHV